MEPNDFDGRWKPRLPTDPDYWEKLSNRIVTGADATLQEHRNGERWWNALGVFGPRLGLIAATLGAVIWWSAPSERLVRIPVARFQDALAPTDPLARGLVLSESVPDISILLRLHRAGGAAP